MRVNAPNNEANSIYSCKGKQTKNSVEKYGTQIRLCESFIQCVTIVEMNDECVIAKIAEKKIQLKINQNN